MDGESFSQRVRRLRLARGLSQESLGQRSSTNRQTVFDVERGKTKRVTADTLNAWAEALGVTPFYLENGYDLGPSGYERMSDVPFEVYMRNTHSDLNEQEIEALRVVVEGVILRARLERGHRGDTGGADHATTGRDGD